MENKEQQRELIEVKNQIAEHFTESDWLELGIILDSSDSIGKHPRLLKSLRFGDDDYEGCILKVLTKIIEENSKNQNKIMPYNPHPPPPSQHPPERIRLFAGGNVFCYKNINEINNIINGETTYHKVPIRF